MARITAYEASDKSLHRDRKAYLRHEANLVAAQKIAALIAQTEASSADGGAGIAAFVNKNIEALRVIFATPFVPGAEAGDAGEPGDAGETGAEAAAPAEKAVEASAPEGI